MTKFNIYDLITRIHPRPAMYIGAHSLVRLNSFLDGCSFLAAEYGIERSETPDFGDFHDWVARRFGWIESTAGWCNIILKECGGNESMALDCFFNLVAEYRNIST